VDKVMCVVNNGRYFSVFITVNFIVVFINMYSNKEQLRGSSLLVMGCHA
jgi:hypothetical protein